MRRLSIVVVMFVLVVFRLPVSLRAADQCYPQTQQCISGRFAAFWNTNGALPVFGYPITAQGNELNRDTNQTYLTQWFERNRFEQHPENKAPYDVLLGRLGDDRLRQLGRDWQTEPRESGPQAGCLWFDATGHNVCNQAPGKGFLAYWQANGLRDPLLNAYGKSLALFGLPLTTPKMETNSSGDTVLTQWFERARFEWHPDKPDPYKVLLGLLGNEVHGASPAPSPQPSPGPSPSTPPVPTPDGACAQNAPAPAEGAQAWMTVTNPATRSDTTLCVRLLRNGQVIAGAQASGVAYYKSTNTALGPATTGPDGVAAMTFSIGGASPGFTVRVDATVVYAGQTYTASTSFTPQ